MRTILPTTTLFCIVKGLLLIACMIKADRSSCHSVTTDFRLPGNTVTINSIIGIPDGEQVEIRCDCLAPRRRAPEWSYDEEDLPDTARDDDEPYVDSTLTRVTLRVDSFRESSSGLYTCHSRDTTVEFNLAWYEPGERPQLVVEPKKQNVKIRNGDENVTLECTAFDAVVTWERRNGEIPNKALLKEGGAILEIPNIRREDDGDYRCTAENDFGMTRSKYVKVSVTEELEIVMDPRDVAPRIGTNVTLTCGSEGFQSENFIYLWTKSSNDLVYSEASPSGTSNLVFPVVRPSDSGEYRCIVQNEWGAQATSKQANLQVVIPVPFPSINQSRGTINQFSVMLNWELSTINADLLDSIVISTEWISLLVYGGGTNGKRQITGNTATVTINDLTATQYTFTDLQPFSHYCFTVTALYAFEGQALGEAAAEPFCTNTSEAAPSAPQDVTVLSQGFTSLTLIWTTPRSPNGIILNYTIQYNDEIKVIAVEDVKPAYILSPLLTGTVYSISVSATNGVGEGNYSNIITTNTLSQEPTEGREELLFQIKLNIDGIEFCPLWISDNHRQLIASAVSDHIMKECNCMLEEEAIDQDHLQCDQSQSNTTVFRAEIVTYQLTYDDLLIIIQNMVTGGRLMLNESTVFRLDNNCPVEISSFNDPLCTPPITDSVQDEETQSNKSSPTAAVVGSVTAVVIAILLLIFVSSLMLYWRSRHRKNTTQDGQSEVRCNNNTLQAQTMPYSSPLPLTVLNSIQKECQVGKGGYMLSNSDKMENTDFPTPYVDFDDEIYFKSIMNNMTSRREGSQVKLQLNPSYFGTDIPDNNSTEV